MICLQCDGTGQMSCDEEVPDYIHGGYIREIFVTCDACDGCGELEDDDGQV
jgi:hypothetical protein